MLTILFFFFTPLLFYSGVWQHYSKISPLCKNKEDRIAAGLKSYSKINFIAALTEMSLVEALSGKLIKQINFAFHLDGSFEVNAAKIKIKEDLIKEANKRENERQRKLLNKSAITVLKCDKILKIAEEQLNYSQSPLEGKKKSVVRILGNEELLKSIPEEVQVLALRTVTQLYKRNHMKKNRAGGYDDEDWNFKMSDFIPSESPSSFYRIASSSSSAASSSSSSSSTSTSSSFSSSSPSSSTSTSSFASFSSGASSSSLSFITYNSNQNNISNGSKSSCNGKSGSAISGSDYDARTNSRINCSRGEGNNGQVAEKDLRHKRKRFQVLHYNPSLWDNNNDNYGAHGTTLGSSPTSKRGQRRGGGTRRPDPAPPLKMSKICPLGMTDRRRRSILEMNCKREESPLGTVCPEGLSPLGLLGIICDKATSLGTVDGTISKSGASTTYDTETESEGGEESEIGLAFKNYAHL